MPPACVLHQTILRGLPMAPPEASVKSSRTPVPHSRDPLRTTARDGAASFPFTLCSPHICSLEPSPMNKCRNTSQLPQGLLSKGKTRTSESLLSTENRWKKEITEVFSF